MDYGFDGFAPQGWRCPVCKRVYSPSTPMCFYCGNGEPTISTTLTFGGHNDDSLYENMPTNIRAKEEKDK